MNSKKKSLLVIHKDITDSTMLDAMKLIKTETEIPENFLIIAAQQTEGMGRNQNKWKSPNGGLWFTYGLKAIGVSHQVTLLLGLCLHTILHKNYPFLHNKLKIKWPNDLLIEKRKLSGILVRVHEGYLLIGVGINTNNDVNPLGSFFEPISLKQYHGFEISNQAILNSFLNYFNQLYSDFIRKGFGFYKNHLNQHLFALNQELAFETGNETKTGICRGVSEDGALILENKDRTCSTYYSGSILSTLE